MKTNLISEMFPVLKGMKEIFKGGKYKQKKADEPFLNLQIGKHFTLKEYIYSDIANQFFINNFPGVDGSPSQSEVIANLISLATNIIDIISDKYPKVVIKSGYRCLALNTKMGGSPISQYIFGQAVDLQVPGVSSAILYNYIYDNVPTWDQLIWKFPENTQGSGVYVSWSNVKNRRKTTLASNVPSNHKKHCKKETKSMFSHGLGQINIDLI